MTTEKIIQEMKRYCKAGLLDGLEIDAVWCGNTFRMVNVHIDDYGLRFDQLRLDAGEWKPCQDCVLVSHQVNPYLNDCIKEMRRLIKIDKNMF